MFTSAKPGAASAAAAGSQVSGKAL